MKRTDFLRTLSLSCLGLPLIGFSKNPRVLFDKRHVSRTGNPFKLSLAQWSLNKSIIGGQLNPYHFAKVANGYGFSGLEYVGQLYKDIYNCDDKEKALRTFIKRSNEEAKKYGLQNVLIMVDGEGDLAGNNKSKRLKAVKNHKLWVDTAAAMGCDAIRVNLYGSKDKKLWKDASQKSLTALCEYAKDFNINILVENHGNLSSNAALLMKVINAVNLPNCGTLPDFGNFCIDRDKNGCAKEYDKYLGVKEMLPKAGAVSAKSYDFNIKGNETSINYGKMMTLIKNSGYEGFIGVEYEGDRLSEEEGILSTKKLIEKFLHNKRS